MRRYKVDVKLAATLYVLAENEDEAMQRINSLIGTESAPETLELGTSDEDFSLDGEGSFLSPAFTAYGRWGTPEEWDLFPGDPGYEPETPEASIADMLPPEWGSQQWAETHGDDLGESQDF